MFGKINNFYLKEKWGETTMWRIYPGGGGSDTTRDGVNTGKTKVTFYMDSLKALLFALLLYKCKLITFFIFIFQVST